MITYLKCSECDATEAELDIPSVDVWNPDIPGYEHFLICPHCHSREGSFETVHACETCEELEPLVDGSDDCRACFDEAASLEGDLVALEMEYGLNE